jgi:hypothetical protein
MKRTIFLLAALLFITASMTSCLKTRTCECRSASNPSSNYNYTVGPSSLKKAKAECENYEFDSGITDYSCDLN